MPTYDYQCDACQHLFEEFQMFSEKPLKKCPKCKKSKLRRLLGTGAAIIFKGSGFYQTDYRSDSYKAAAKADQPPPTADANKDSKPVTPAPTATTSPDKGTSEKSSGKNAKSKE